MAPGAVRRSEGSTTTSQRSKRDRDTEPDLIRNQDILRKISTTKNLPRSFVMGSEASERSEKNSITTSKATQRGTVTFPVDLYFKRSGRAALNFFFRVGDSSCGCTHGAPPAAGDAADASGVAKHRRFHRQAPWALFIVVVMGSALRSG
mgnify:CR=1 FL=1